MNTERDIPLDPPKIMRSCVERLSHKIVSDWVEETNLSLRPSDKAALKKMMCTQIPNFIEDNHAYLCERYLDTVRFSVRNACIDAISKLEEPISGLINKQLTLNVCTYAHAAHDEDDSESQEPDKQAQH